MVTNCHRDALSWLWGHWPPVPRPYSLAKLFSARLMLSACRLHPGCLLHDMYLLGQPCGRHQCCAGGCARPKCGLCRLPRAVLPCTWPSRYPRNPPWAGPCLAPFVALSLWAIVGKSGSYSGLQPASCGMLRGGCVAHVCACWGNVPCFAVCIPKDMKGNCMERAEKGGAGWRSCVRERSKRQERAKGGEGGVN